MSEAGSRSHTRAVFYPAVAYEKCLSEVHGEMQPGTGMHAIVGDRLGYLDRLPVHRFLKISEDGFDVNLFSEPIGCGLRIAMVVHPVFDIDNGLRDWVRS